MYKFLNLNPCHIQTVDCVIRACAKALDKTWDDTYLDLAFKGISLCRIMNDNITWGEYLQDNHFTKHDFNGTVIEFTRKHPFGTYVLGTGSHAVCVIDSTYYDISDCGDETVFYFYQKEV